MGKSLREHVKKNGLFLVFEGPDGSGKTTVAKTLDLKFNELGYNCIYCANPGGGDIGKGISRIVKNNKMDNITASMLFLAGIRDNILNIVKPALKENHIVIMDRFLRSSWIYQHMYAPDELELKNEYNKRLELYKLMVSNAMQYIIPDHEFVLFPQRDPNILIHRINTRNDRDVFEENDNNILEINNQYYKSVITPPFFQFGDVQTLDAELNVDVIVNDILWGLDGRPEKRGTVYKEH